MAFPKDLEPIVKKASPATNAPSAANPTPKPDTIKQLASQDEAGRRASATHSALADKNHARHMSKPLNPSNLQIVTSIATQGGRLVVNPLVKPTANPSVAIGLKKLGTLAPIPPFKPRNQATQNAPSTSTSEKKNDSKPAPQPSKLASRFANLPPIPPFKPKSNTNDSNSKDSKVPSTKGATGSNAPTNTSGKKSGEYGSVPPNPFFGHTPIKKGSSSIHVKEEFTPFKNGSVPEASSVGPAWNFTGKSYRQIFAANLPPQHHHGHFVPHGMHHPISHHHHHQQPQPHQHQHMHPHVHPQHPQGHGAHGLSHPPHSQIGHMMAPPMHMHHSQQPHYGHHPPHPPSIVPQMMTEDDGMSGPMNGVNPGGPMVPGGNGHVVNGAGMMMAAGGGGGGMPGAAGPGYMPHNGPAMNQQQPHPHHLPPPIPPYMYHPQHHPQQQSPMSPYNGSYRQTHPGAGPSGANLGYGPPVPVNVNMSGPVPAPHYGTGPPVVPVPGNPSGPPFVNQMSGYSGSPIHGPGAPNNGPSGNGAVVGAGGPPVHYNNSPQMGALPGHGPPGGMYGPPQMYPPGGDNGGGGSHGSHGPSHNGHGGGGHGHGHHGGGAHHHHHSHSSGHGHHGHGGGGHHSNGPSPTIGVGNNHMGGRGRGNSGANNNSGNGNNNNHNHSGNNTSSNSNQNPRSSTPTPTATGASNAVNNGQMFNYQASNNS